MNRRVAVRGIIVKDSTLLCVRQSSYADSLTGVTNEYWNTPGGGVDEGEALLPALERELVEELGVKPIIGNLLYVQQFRYDGREHMEFFFHVTNADDYTDLDLSQTSHGAQEIAEVGFVDPKKKNVLPVFLRHEDMPFGTARHTGTKFFDYMGTK